MAGETDLDDPLKLDKATKSGDYFSSPIDDNDLVRTGCYGNDFL